MRGLLFRAGHISCDQLPFLFLLGVVCGFNFGFRPRSSLILREDGQALSENEIQDPPVSDLEQSLQDLELETDKEESSCYSRIFGSLKTEEKLLTSEPSLCSALSRSEAHRTAFAARLTICELQTNDLKLPKECTLWIEAGSEPSSGQLQACVGALHASPQSWSSFTGHQRDAVQLCFAHHKLQGIEIATSSNLKTIKFATDMIRLGRVDQQSSKADLKELSDHMRILFDESIQNFNSISEINRQDSKRVFQELENHLRDFKRQLLDLSEEILQESNHKQNQQIYKIHEAFQSLSTSQELKINENLNNFIESMKVGIEQKIQSSLDHASSQIIENLKDAFVIESQLNSLNIHNQVKKGFEAIIDLVSQRHDEALEKSIELQSQKMVALLDDFLALDKTLKSMRNEHDLFRIRAIHNENVLEKAQEAIKEQQIKGEELIEKFIETMTIHKVMIEKLSSSVSNSPIFLSYSFITKGNGWIKRIFKFLFYKLSISSLRIILGWSIWFAWMSGGMNWMIKFGLLKAGMFFFIMTVQIPFRWLKCKFSPRIEKDLKLLSFPSSIPDDREKISTDKESVESRSQSFTNARLDLNQIQINSRQNFKSYRRTLTGSRIVPKRLIIN